MASTPRALTRLVAIMAAIPLMSCSFNLKMDSDPPEKQLPADNQDASACQQAGFPLGSPEHQKCMDALTRQRADAQRDQARPR